MNTLRSKEGKDNGRRMVLSLVGCSGGGGASELENGGQGPGRVLF